MAGHRGEKENDRGASDGQARKAARVDDALTGTCGEGRADAGETPRYPVAERRRSRAAARKECRAAADRGAGYETAPDAEFSDAGEELPQA